ncbi:carboxypeptidase regulatory-like domain-containing protein [Saccharothrix saharensis]|uniref:carboxypeptidase regulatory-like domain-containing protein n=1 Tax=Saccharothrix saharensis TaxID=571190 RepID=UPI0036A9BD3C
MSAENVKPGDEVQVQFRVTNNGSGADTAIVVVGGGLKCTTGCRAEPNLKPGQSQDFQATVVAPDVNAGETLGVNISVAVRLGGQNSYDYRMVYIHGAGATQPEVVKPPSEVVKPPSEVVKPPSVVDGVSGSVRDTSGKAIGGVALTVQDSAGHEYRTTSDQSGRFSIKSDPAKPIAEGQITVDAALDGYRATRATVRGSAGGTASVELTLAAVAVPAETPQSPTATTTAVNETPASDISTAAAPSSALDAGSDEGSGSLPFILGGLLVAAGLGAVALVVYRRRNTPDGPAVHAATHLTAPAGAGMSDAPTVVLHMGPTADGFPGPNTGPAQGGNQQRSDGPYGGPGL